MVSIKLTVVNKDGVGQNTLLSATHALNAGWHGRTESDPTDSAYSADSNGAAICHVCIILFLICDGILSGCLPYKDFYKSTTARSISDVENTTDAKELLQACKEIYHEFK